MTTTDKNRVHYPDLNPFDTGLRGRCPRCGEGKMLSGLSVNERCAACGLDFDYADAGDGPAVFIILILGFVVAGGAVATELNYQPPFWVHVLIWPPILLLLGLPMLRIAKGILLAAQYKTSAEASARIERDTR